VLWYFSNLASRAALDLSVLAQQTFRGVEDWDETESGFGSFGDIQAMLDVPVTAEEFGNRVIDLAGHVGDLVKAFWRGEFNNNRDRISGHMPDVLRALIAAADAAAVDLEEAARILPSFIH
jgi:hypothetical protein